MEPKDNSGVLFRNDAADDDNRQPNFRGHLTTDGQKFSLGAWNQTTHPVDEPTRGLIVRNDAKASDKHPDYIGSVRLESGKRLYISGWERTSKAGNQYISLAVRAHKSEDGDKIAKSPELLFSLRIKEWQ